VTRSRDITQTSHLAGLKIRTIQTPIYVKAVELMGASPTPMAFGEVYTSLQTGVIDGYEHDANTTIQQRFYEIAGFMARTGHIAGVLGCGRPRRCAAAPMRARPEGAAPRPPGATAHQGGYSTDSGGPRHDHRDIAAPRRWAAARLETEARTLGHSGSALRGARHERPSPLAMDRAPVVACASRGGAGRGRGAAGRRRRVLHQLIPPKNCAPCCVADVGGITAMRHGSTRVTALVRLLPDARRLAGDRGSMVAGVFISVGPAWQSRSSAGERLPASDISGAWIHDSAGRTGSDVAVVAQGLHSSRERSSLMVAGYGGLVILG
jgi:hypothetical protein